MCIIKDINIFHFSLIVIAFLSASQISSALVQNGSEEILMFPHAALDVFLLCSFQHSHPSWGQSKDSLFFLKISFTGFFCLQQSQGTTPRVTPKPVIQMFEGREWAQERKSWRGRAQERELKRVLKKELKNKLKRRSLRDH